jgi:hypothetical protein
VCECVCRVCNIVEESDQPALVGPHTAPRAVTARSLAVLLGVLMYLQYPLIEPPVLADILHECLDRTFHNCYRALCAAALLILVPLPRYEASTIGLKIGIERGCRGRGNMTSIALCVLLRTLIGSRIVFARMKQCMVKKPCCMACNPPGRWSLCLRSPGPSLL